MPAYTYDTLTHQILDTWLDFRSRYGELPGFQVSIRKGGKLIFNKAYGLANVTKKTTYTPAHIGHVASNSKMLTSCLLLTLHEQGVLSLQDKLVKHLPQLKKHKDKRFGAITLRDLVSHRSGICRDGVDSSYWAHEKEFPSREVFLREVMSTNLVYSPNTCSKYSNFGFGLLGLAIEAAGQDSYENLLQRHVISKLSGCQIYPDYSSQPKGLFADGHSHAVYQGQRKPLKHIRTHALAAASGACANTESTTQFLHNFLFTDKLLTEATRKDLLHLVWQVQNVKDRPYGLGLQHSTVGNNIYLGHNGTCPGFTSRTAALAGTEYVYGLIVNANDVSDYDFIRSMAELTQKLQNVFSPPELKKIIVSQPFMNRWGAFMCVVGEHKALTLSLDSWLLMADVTVLARHKDGYFYADKLNGYGNVGEPKQFIQRHKTIVAVKNGANTIYPESVFLKKSAVSWL